MRQVALLRGININPRSQVDMADLRGLLGRLGFTDVRTHLRSGNAIFEADGRPPEEVSPVIEAALAEDLGVRAAVMVRTAADLRAVVEDNPLPVPDPAKFAVVFLAEPPDRALLESLDPAAYAPEEMGIGRRELYIHYPEGLRRPRLQPLLEKRSGLVGTARNWNTVTRLLALAEG